LGGKVSIRRGSEEVEEKPLANIEARGEGSEEVPGREIVKRVKPTTPMGSPKEDRVEHGLSPARP